MTIALGLDIGSNSVGSAWVDTEQKTIALGVSVFPAGVDETDTKRGAPVNQKRREKRSQRRSLARRAQRKRLLRQTLTGAGLLPSDPQQLADLFRTNPWTLRRDALRRGLTPHEFGRVVLHLGQRRGAVGIETDPEDKEEGKVKEAIDRLHALKQERHAETFGQLMADLMDERRKPLATTGKTYQEPIRNRQYRMPESDQLYADRPLVRAEFDTLWEKQKSFGGELAGLLTDELKRALDDPCEDDTWRHKGVLFGQRRTYWDTGTLGRCDLEPTDQRCPLADMYAQEFRVVETVNNIRIEERDKPPRSLTPEERADVIAALRKQKTGSVATVRKALGIDKKAIKAFYTLNIERDPDREINTDWFCREIVHGVFTEEHWRQMDGRQRESVNRALLRFDPDTPAHTDALRAGAQRWWDLSAETAEKFLAAWKARPKLEKRVNLSRRAIQNLLPYMNEFDPVMNRWPTQIEARQRFGEDGSHDAPIEQRRRYALDAPTLTKADRHYLSKHPELLPPAPVLANPVVRKAIHEVRRHILSYLRRFGRKPDRVVIEFARAAKQSGKVRQAALDRNRWREKARKDVIAHFNLGALSLNQQRAAVERVLLCRQQRYICAYTGETITEDRAAQGTDVETDHIVPYSRCGDNGLNNKVLCCRASNRGKGNKTPREWLGERFAGLQQRFAHFERYKPQKGEADQYFSPKDYARKWENLTREVREEEEWKNSQLTDTAYAARQVASYLRDGLYRDRTDATRRIFVTKGKYTALLRRDWQLFKNVRRGRGDAEGTPPGGEEAQPPREKQRADHRHHAIDAVTIALTDPQIEPILAGQAAEAEEYHERTGHWLQRTPLTPPWGTVDEFRAQVMTEVDGLVVSHRPAKRKASGFLHKEDLWGAVNEEQGIFRIRCNVGELSPKMLRMPVEETDDQARKRLVGELKQTGLKDREARAKARELLERGQFERRRIEPSLGKGGLVRDWGLRRIIRGCLQDNGVNADSFTARQIADLAQSGKLHMPSGVPIKSVVTIGPISDPVRIPVKDPFTRQQAVNPRTGRPLYRYHISRNNHHSEIREDVTTGAWSDDCVSMFRAAQRVRPAKDRNGKRVASQPAVDRSDRDGQRFIMSLCEGETVYMRHPRTAELGFFVVFKLSPGRLFFVNHWDARRSVPEKDEQAGEVPGTRREEIDLAPADLKGCGPEPNQPPYKVRVSPLGEVQRLDRD